jgi:hypothetical protein
MNRHQLRAIARFYNPIQKLPLSTIGAVSTVTQPRDKYRGTYKLKAKGGIIQSNWIGRTNSIITNEIALVTNGNNLYGNN